MWFPISTETGSSGGGSGTIFKVIHGTRPTTADPGTIWVNNGVKDSSQDVAIATSAPTSALKNFDGVVLILEPGTPTPGNGTRITEHLYLRLSDTLVVSAGALLTKVYGQWKIMCYDGVWR